MPKYIVKSVSLDEDVHDYICDAVDGKDEMKKNFSRSFNYQIHKLIALEKELKEIKMLDSGKHPVVNISNN